VLLKKDGGLRAFQGGKKTPPNSLLQEEGESFNGFVISSRKRGRKTSIDGSHRREDHPYPSPRRIVLGGESQPLAVSTLRPSTTSC